MDLNTLTDQIFKFLVAHNGEGDLTNIAGLEKIETQRLVVDPLIQKGYIRHLSNNEGLVVSLTPIGNEIAKWRKG